MVPLCIAESWLDERIQSGDGALEKLEFEIEAFLKSKEKKNRRNSLESVPFNILSAPIQEVDSGEEEEEEDDFDENKTSLNCSS
uniref:Uncharacterized protein n=1 Tax=Noccaea caerulescens TaxID=107243 RepID=A0A1J3EJG6_NOCCA